MDHDILIAGAGPVGLSLALGLARAGKSVLILEKEAGLREHSRAPAIWPRTQEVLSDLGVIDPILSEGISVEDFRFWDADQDPAKELMHISFLELQHETRFPSLVILPQNKTEAILLKALESYPNVRVKFSSEVVGLKQDADGVTLSYRNAQTTQSATGSLAVGCDGAHSRIRELIGAELTGRTYPIRAALADVQLAQDKAYPFPRLSTRNFLAVAILLEKGVWRLILPYGDKDPMDLNERVQWAVRHLFSQNDFTTIWQSEFKLHRRISTKFVSGRVALAGDAAHLNSPVGGQGMNAGIQDTEILKTALLESLKQNSLDPLSDYGEFRRSRIKGVNRFTNQLTRALLIANGRYVKVVLRIMRFALKNAGLRRGFLNRITMLGPRTPRGRRAF